MNYPKKSLMPSAESVSLEEKVVEFIQKWVDYWEVRLNQNRREENSKGKVISIRLNILESEEE